MKWQVSILSWPKGTPGGVKSIIVAYEPELDMLAARQHYAHTHGFRLVAERPDGQVALYWDRVGNLVRLAIEPVS